MAHTGIRSILITWLYLKQETPIHPLYSILIRVFPHEHGPFLGCYRYSMVFLIFSHMAGRYGWGASYQLGGWQGLQLLVVQSAQGRRSLDQGGDHQVVAIYGNFHGENLGKAWWTLRFCFCFWVFLGQTHDHHGRYSGQCEIWTLVYFFLPQMSPKSSPILKPKVFWNGFGLFLDCFGHWSSSNRRGMGSTFRAGRDGRLVRQGLGPLRQAARALLPGGRGRRAAAQLVLPTGDGEHGSRFQASPGESGLKMLKMLVIGSPSRKHRLLREGWGCHPKMSVPSLVLHRYSTDCDSPEFCTR